MNTNKDYNPEELFGKITCDPHAKVDTLTIRQHVIFAAMQGYILKGVPRASIPELSIETADETIKTINELKK